MEMQQLADLSYLLRKHSKDKTEFNLNLMMCFAIVALNPGIRQKDIVKMTGLTYPTVNNCFNNLSLGRISKEKKSSNDDKPVQVPGLELIEPDIDIYDRRSAKWSLTKKGKELAEEIKLI